jgi:hypothetical protein
MIANAIDTPTAAIGVITQSAIVWGHDLFE